MGGFMGDRFLGWTVVPLVLFVAAVAPALAQFQWPPELSAPTGNEPAASPEGQAASPARPSTTSSIPLGKKPSSPAGPAVSGSWKGELTQIGSTTPYKVELAISPTGAETKYPDLKCTGKLIRVGASKSYVFFIEIITKGASNKGGRCPDGTITMARAGDKLALLWFGTVENDMIIASGTLSK
jgi:hypothetical protein